MAIYGRREYDNENVQWNHLVGLLERVENRVDVLATNDTQYSEELRGIKEQLHQALDELRSEIKHLAEDLDRRVKPLEQFREPFILTRRILLLSIAGLMTCSGIVSAIIIIRDKLF
jgi:hypothetical protein